MAGLSFTCRRILSAAVFASVLLAGCAVDSNGAFRLDADELSAKKLYPFQTVFGDGVLRRTLDGRYQIKLYDRQAIFDVARTDGVLVDSVLSANNETYVTLRIPHPGCQYVYRTLLVKQKEVDRYDLPSDCQTPVSFAMDDGHLLAVQQKPVNARYWMMTDATVVSGIVPAPMPPVATRPVPVEKAQRSTSTALRRKTVKTQTPAANVADSGADSVGKSTPGGAHHLSGVTVVGAPQKVSTADGSNRTPIHIDLDDAH